MAYPKHRQLDFKGSELIIDRIQVQGTGTGINAGGPIAITYTTGNPGITPNNAITIANGATPTVSELLEFCVELNAKFNALLSNA